jgi:transposase-like protein
VTTSGYLGMLEVPRCRKKGFKTTVFRRYKRRWKEVDDYIQGIFIAGVSTRQTGLALKALMGCKPSASTVSSVIKLLDPEVKQFHRHPLTDTYRYLFLDGVWIKVSGYKVVKKVLLIAYGVKHDGSREVIDYRLASSESEREWGAFLSDLYRRGLTGDSLRLIIIDGGKGLRAAVDMVYPHISIQRCWVHKLRNVSLRLRARYREVCLAQASKIYRAKCYRDAVARFRAWARRWQESAPEAVICLKADIEELLTFFKENRRLWTKLRTTNAIERIFRELRKRIRPMCSFANNASCDRIVYAVFKKYNDTGKDRPLWKPEQITQNS